MDEHWYERDDVFDRVIEVPFLPESPASGIGNRDFHPVVWYRRTFPVALPPDERLLLHLGAVDYRASVWVNGRLVAVHEGGHTPFSADVTAVLLDDGENVLTVRAEELWPTRPSPAGSRTGWSVRTASSTSGPQVSGNRLGRSPGPPPTSSHCAGLPTYCAAAWRSEWS